MTVRVSDGIILLLAPAGDVRAARGLVSRAVSNVLGKARNQRPFWVQYLKGSERHDGAPAYLYVAALHQHQAISREIAKLARQEGWSGPPADLYYDERILPAHEIDPADLPYYAK